MRVVLDTNVLASGALAKAPGTIHEVFVALRLASFELLLSEHILAELARTLDKTHFATRLSTQQKLEYVNTIASRSIFIEPNISVTGVASHPADDLVLATAVSGNADYLVTGDLQFQRLGAYEGVAIVSPAQFLAILGAEQDPGTP